MKPPVTNFARTTGRLRPAAHPQLAALCLVACVLAIEFGAHQRESDRWFVPGPTGFETARKEPARGFLVVGGDRSKREGANAGGDGVGRGFRSRVLFDLRESDDAAWSRGNGLTQRFSFSHNLGRIFPPSLHMRHPEWFPLYIGSRLRPAENSFYWNPDLGRIDVAAFAADAARSYFNENPAAESFALGINDGLLFGESAETLAAVTPLRWFRERPDFSNLVFTFTNRVAADLARTHPDKYVGALAYYWAENVPDFPLTPNVVPFLTADRSQGYDRAFRQEELLLQRRWSARQRRWEMGAGGSNSNAQVRIAAEALSPRLGLYDYLFGKGFLIPRIHTRLLAENLRQAHRTGFTDYFAEMSPNWGLDGPMPWLAAQLLQDPEQSPEVLLDEYYRRYFQTAAVPMRQFFERCERLWMSQAGSSYWLKHYRNESQASVFPSKACRELRALLAEAKRVAWNEPVRRRVKFVSDAFGVTERFVEMQEARDDLNRASLAASPDWRELIAGVVAFMQVRQELVDYTNRLLVESPLALTPFRWEDYLRHDPVPNALMRLRAEAQAKGVLASANAVTRGAGCRELTEAWVLCTRTETAMGRSVVRDGEFTGPVRPARRVTGLDYGVALPESWQSSVEPAQFQRAELIEAVGDQPSTAIRQRGSNGSGTRASRVLRLTGNKETSVFQWNAAETRHVYVVAVQVRGHVSSSTVASLTIGWLDAKQQRVGLKTLRLPEGDWPEWVTLRLNGQTPDAAKWVGIGVRVQNQVGGDWVEVKNFELLAVPDAGPGVVD